MKKIWRFSCIFAAILSSTSVHALTFGEINGVAEYGSPFNIKGSLKRKVTDSLNKDCFSAVVNYSGNKQFNSNIEILNKKDDLSTDIGFVVTSMKPVDEPIVNVLLSYKCDANTTRKYTLLSTFSKFRNANVKDDQLIEKNDNTKPIINNDSDIHNILSITNPSKDTKLDKKQVKENRTKIKISPTPDKAVDKKINNNKIVKNTAATLPIDNKVKSNKPIVEIKKEDDTSQKTNVVDQQVSAESQLVLKTFRATEAEIKSNLSAIGNQNNSLSSRLVSIDNQISIIKSSQYSSWLITLLTVILSAYAFSATYFAWIQWKKNKSYKNIEDNINSIEDGKLKSNTIKDSNVDSSQLNNEYLLPKVPQKKLITELDNSSIHNTDTIDINRNIAKIDLEKHEEILECKTIEFIKNEIHKSETEVDFYIDFDNQEEDKPIEFISENKDDQDESHSSSKDSQNGFSTSVSRMEIEKDSLIEFVFENHQEQKPITEDLNFEYIEPQISNVEDNPETVISWVSTSDEISDDIKEESKVDNLDTNVIETVIDDLSIHNEENLNHVNDVDESEMWQDSILQKKILTPAVDTSHVIDAYSKNINFRFDPEIQSRNDAIHLEACGKSNDAIKLLKKLIHDNVDINPFAYLDLLTLYHSLGMKFEFRQYRKVFNSKFNGLVPDYQYFHIQGNYLTEYPETLSELSIHWNNASIFENIGSYIFHDEHSHSKSVYDLNAFKDLLMLYRIAVAIEVK